MDKYHVRHLIFITLLISWPLMASELTHQFGNPSFSGSGYSQHVLSIDQLQNTRKDDNRKQARSDAAAAERLANNTTINKFIKNVESRIYANLSKQLVDNMFGTNCEVTETNTCPSSGTATVEDSQIYWIKSGSGSDEVITLTITDCLLYTSPSPRDRG